MKFKDSKKYLNEDSDDRNKLFSGSHHDTAKDGYDKLESASGTIGSHKGNVRRYFHHVGGDLVKTMYGDHDHRSYATPSRTSGSGHYFAFKYTPNKHKDEHVYTHVKLPRSFDLSDTKAIALEIEKQNPHLKGTGHPINLASHIRDYHGKK